MAHYKILSLLGEGGMGKVYLAHDTKLNRKVALKFLPDQFSANHDHIRRFTQEAMSSAALHQPNIAQIFEIGNYHRAHYIAMEYVEGETLRQLLSRRKLEIKKAVEFAAQVASGLAAAHKVGVIHRDIKPENLIATPSGQIKILDFGLAKVSPPRPVSVASGFIDKEAATRLQVHTQPGSILGTVSYMSPEHARAEELDQRTDIFSLGVVLYEMVTGERPFKGNSAVDTLHAIINQEPQPVTRLNSQLPPELAEILGKALAKDTSERYQHAGDFELDLRRLKRGIESDTLISTKYGRVGLDTKAKRSARPAYIAGGVVAVVLIVSAAWLFGRWTGSSRTLRPNFMNATLAPLTSDPGYEGEPTFSPDGETIAYVSDRSGNLEIYLKQISGGADINLTNSPADDVQPAFSPDGKSIAFVSTRSTSSAILYYGYDLPLMGGDIWVMPALGGGTRRVVISGNFPSWSPDGTAILYSGGVQRKQKIYRVPAIGGDPTEIPIAFKPGEPAPRFVLYPSYSPDGRWIVFEADITTDNIVYVVSAEGGEAKVIARGKHPTWQANSEAIIYSNTERGKNQSLWQILFSSASGEASDAEPLTIGRGRDAQTAVSRDGKRVAFTALNLSFNVEIVPFDAEAGRVMGTPQQITIGNDVIYFVNFSPDGRSIVFESHRGATSHIWRTDIGSPAVKLTSDPNLDDLYPRWSPDGTSVAFIRRRSNEPRSVSSLWVMTPDGGNPRKLIDRVGPFSFAWMPDSKGLVYFSDADGQAYLFDLTTQNRRQITNEADISFIPVVSADGKWLIYQSTMSGNIDIRVTQLVGGESRVVVATPHNDFHPFVSFNGRWLYFQLDHKNIYRVPGPAQDWQKSVPEKVTNYPESNLFLEDPQLSRDGRQLLLARGRVTGEIWILNTGK